VFVAKRYGHLFASFTDNFETSNKCPLQVIACNELRKRHLATATQQVLAFIANVAQAFKRRFVHIALR
jgi:hypothetical protein